MSSGIMVLMVVFGQPVKVRGQVFRRNHLIGGINKYKAIFCCFLKERHISIVMFIQSNLLFEKYSHQGWNLKMERFNVKFTLMPSINGFFHWKLHKDSFVGVRLQKIGYHVDSIFFLLKYSKMLSLLSCAVIVTVDSL